MRARDILIVGAVTLMFFLAGVLAGVGLFALKHGIP